MRLASRLPGTSPAGRSDADSRKWKLLGRGTGSTTLLEALAAEYWATLRGFEGHSRFLAAMRTSRAGLDLLITIYWSCAQCVRPFCLAGFAPFRFILELLVVEEELFAGGEQKFRAAVDALEQPVLEFHVRSPRPSCALP